MASHARLALSIAAAVLAACLATPPAQAAPPRKDAVSKAARGVMKAGAPGVLVAVREQDAGRSRVWSVHRGLADLDSRRRVEGPEHFRIASVTKMFMGATVLQLVGERRLGLDDTVERWLPGAMPRLRADRITVRMLLDHTSGVPDPTQELLGDPGSFPDDVTPAALAAIASAMPPTFAPGTSWSYTNAGYWLLAMIVANATGRTYDEQIQDRIIEPLRLRHTRLPRDVMTLPRPFLHAYTRRPHRPPLDVTAFNASWGSSSGGMISTAHDLNRFSRALLTGRLLPQPLLRAMKRGVPVPPNPTGASRYGFGLTVTRLPCGRIVYGNAGGLAGFTTRTSSTGDGRRQITVAANTDELVPIDRAITKVVSAYFCGPGT